MSIPPIGYFNITAVQT